MPFESPDSHTFAMPEVAHGYEAGKIKKRKKKLEKENPLLNFLFVQKANSYRVFHMKNFICNHRHGQPNCEF